MPIFKPGQVVQPRSGDFAVVNRREIHESLPMGNIEYYWVTLPRNGQRLHVRDVDIMRIEEHVNPSQKFKTVAKKKRTTGIWYSSGPAL